MSTSTQTEARPPAVDEQRRVALWAVQRSQRYHSRRCAFYERWNKATAFAGVVGGSAVFASIGKGMPGWVATYAAAAVILISGADLVAGAADMARKHNDLRRRFCELESEIISVAQPAEPDLAKWKAKRLAIESDEPPTYVALNILCDNEQIRAQYPKDRHADLLHHIPFLKRLTAHVFIWANT